MKIIDRFSSLGLSRQRVYQLRRQEKRLCTQCGEKTKFGLRLCWECNSANIKRMRIKNGCKPWKKGSCGRPPNAILAEKIKKTIDTKKRKE